MKIPPVRASQARAAAILTGLLAATANDSRTRALFEGWSLKVQPLVQKAVRLKDPWPALFNIALTLTPSSDRFTFAQLEASVSYGPLLALMLPLQYVVERAEELGLQWSDDVDEIPAPPVAPFLPFRPGETTDQARARLKILFRETMASLAAVERAARGGGNMPRSKIGQLAQWGSWLYDVELRAAPRPTAHALERALHDTRRAAGKHTQPFPRCGCSGAVRQAIVTAKRYLEDLSR